MSDVADATNVPDISDVTDVADAPGVIDVTDATDIANVTDVTDTSELIAKTNEFNENWHEQRSKRRTDVTGVAENQCIRPNPRNRRKRGNRPNL